MKRLIGLRRQHQVFGRGAIEFVPSPNRKVLAYVRRDENDTILCVANLSRTVQPIELDLTPFRGLVPVEMLGHSEFPRIGDQPYFLSLGAYGFNWFRLQPAAPAITERTIPEATAAVPDLPALLVGPVWDTLLDGTVRNLIERDLLCAFLHRQPWFQGPRPRSARFVDWGLLRRGQEPLFAAIVEAELDDASDDGGGVRRQFFLPLALVSAEKATAVHERFPHAVLARVTGARKGAIFDASHDVRLTDELLAAATDARALGTRHGRIDARRRESLVPQRRADDPPEPASRALTTGASVAGGSPALKLFRRLEAGEHPEVEMAEHLAALGFARGPNVSAVIDYTPVGEPARSIGMFTQSQPSADSQADGWLHAMDWLTRFFDRVAALDLPASAQTPAAGDEVALAAVSDPMIEYLEVAAAFGRRTAEMHLALAADSADPGFAPEPLTQADLANATARALAQAERTLAALDAVVRSTGSRVPPDVAVHAGVLLGARGLLIDTIRSAAVLEPAVTKIRIHGDYRLGQVLLIEGDVYIQNIEGHLAWPAAAQREKQSPLKDVAGMVRSFSYAAHAALLTYPSTGPDRRAHLSGWAQAWQRWTTSAFLRSYYATAATSATLPQDASARAALVGFFLVDRALRELDGELNNRPEWIGIPVSGLLESLRLR